MKKKYKYPIETIVSLKNHPLFYTLEIKEIKGDGKLIPPFMIVKEVLIESKNKITHSEELGEQIADKVKYTCVFFDDNRTEFKEAILYESMLKDYNEIHIARKDGVINEKKEGYQSLIEETKNYVTPKYVYGNIVFFRTKKFEIFKKRSSVKVSETIINQGKPENKEVKTLQYVVNYSSPEFVLCGIKKNENQAEYYPNGKLKKKTSKTLFKVKWFNASQMKFSDIYLPSECFTNVQPFPSEVAYNTELN